MKYFIVFSAVSIMVMFFCVIYTIHVAIEFQRFNDGIKDWANALDESTKDAINRSAREILRELDEKISEANLTEQTEKENVEPLNEENNE